MNHFTMKEYMSDFLLMNEKEIDEAVYIAVRCGFVNCDHYDRLKIVIRTPEELGLYLTKEDYIICETCKIPSCDVENYFCNDTLKQEAKKGCDE